MARRVPRSARVGTARRRRPTPCGEAAPISEKRRRRRLKLGAPTARRPYQLTRRVLPHHGAKRSSFREGRDGAPPPFDSPLGKAEALLNLIVWFASSVADVFE